MIETPMDVLKEHPIRRTRKQKQAFRESVRSYMERQGYSVTVEREAGNIRNMIFGDPEAARFLITAHYDTPAAAWGPNLQMPGSKFMNGLCRLFNALVGLIPAVAAGAVTYVLTWDLWYAHIALAAAAALRVLLMFCGPANRHNANGNTSGVVTLLETAASMPRTLRRRVCFVLLDRGEPSMAGSAAYRKRHPYASKYQTVLDLNSVGHGDELTCFPSRGLGEDVNLLCQERSCGDKAVVIWKKKRNAWVSDCVNFPRSVGVTALRRGKLGLWQSRTHTRRDTVLDYTNVNILRACLISYIGSPAAE